MGKNFEISNQRLFKVGYFTTIFGVALILLWIGIFKFTLTEAKAIEPLVQSHFLMSWLYGVFSIQWVSNIIGVIEIITALCLILVPFCQKIKKVTSFLVFLTFVTTLSFLITTTKISWIEGVPVTDFFILKDIIPLGFSLIILGVSISEK